MTTEDEVPDTQPGPYFVSVYDEETGRRGFLLGPYDTHQEALDNVSRGHDLACKADPWASFYAFGTCRWTDPARTPPPAVFGK